MSMECEFRGMLRGHGGWVTALTVPGNEEANTLLSASRDKSVILWDLTYEAGQYGVARRRLTSHSHFVEDVVMSSDGVFALSASWDRMLRLWDLQKGTSVPFRGHRGDALSVSFSHDNRQIVSGSRDSTIRLWNTLGECKHTMDGHSDWVSCVRFSPNSTVPTVVSGSWDRSVKVWNMKDGRAHADYLGHKGFVSSVAVSPDARYAVSGGKDGRVFSWDLEADKMHTLFEVGPIVNDLAFATNRYWLAAATDAGFKVWDFESQKEIISLDKASYPAEFFGSDSPGSPQCMSITFKTGAGNKAVLLTGWSDNHIRVFECP